MPPRTKSSESKQGLVVTLVFFILLAIILGVTTYYGWAGQAKLKADQKKAVEEKNDMTAQRDAEKFQKAMLKIAVGIADNDDTLFFDGNKAKEKSVFDKLLASLKGLQWTPDQSKPADSYLQIVDKMTATVTKQQQDAAQAKKAADESVENLNKQLADKDEANKQLQDQYKAALEAKNKAIESKSDAFQQEAKQLQQAQDETRKLKKQMDDLKDEQEKVASKKDKLIKDLERKSEREEITKTKVPLLDYTKPWGKIITISRGGKSAYINLGSDDHVKPQLTFSVYGPGNFKADQAPKGTVEVANVLEAHLSLARITDVKDPNRDPILVGDQLFNPAWNPTLRQHVAIAGLIDLTGDGRDSTAQFVRELQRQGIVVDAWLDLKDATIKGKGITFQTNYLVLGPTPEFDESSAPLQRGTPSTEHKTEIITKMTEMQDKANRFGVTTVPVQRFMALIGYRLPRQLPKANYEARPYEAPTETKPAAPEAEKKLGQGSGGEQPAQGNGAKKKPAEDEGGDEGEPAMKPPAKKPPAKKAPAGKKPPTDEGE